MTKVIGCTNVGFKNCKNSVAIGIRDEEFNDLDQAVIVRNIYAVKDGEGKGGDLMGDNVVGDNMKAGKLEVGKIITDKIYVNNIYSKFDCSYIRGIGGDSIITYVNVKLENDFIFCDAYYGKIVIYLRDVYDVGKRITFKIAVSKFEVEFVFLNEYINEENVVTKKIVVKKNGVINMRLVKILDKMFWISE